MRVTTPAMGIAATVPAWQQPSRRASTSASPIRWRGRHAWPPVWSTGHSMSVPSDASADGACRGGHRLDQPLEVDLLIGLVGGGDPAQRSAVVVEDRCRNRREPGRDLTVLGGVPALAGLAEDAPQRAQALRAATVPVDERTLVRVE